MANRLQHETSPYLLQHANNPVDWYPWGPEALTRAKTENKPILLSVGYSACHWCHVMEHESFENAQIAELMNRHFINIKVDREERPDLDQIYQNVAQLITRGGGWPLTVFLTPDLKPFFGGTYFPPEDRWGRAGFGRVLQSLADAFQNDFASVEENATRLTNAIRELESRAADENHRPNTEALVKIAESLLADVDLENGGFGHQPKFPNTMNLSYLWRVFTAQAATHPESAEALGSLAVRCKEATLSALIKMAQGGIYDQLGGGFHRYSVDARWAVPHFEKMLYDNALLLKLYSEVLLTESDVGPALHKNSLLTLHERALFQATVAETVEYVLREMTSPEACFYSTQDADSEGEEGKFFAWSPEHLGKLLVPEDAALFSKYYGVSERGNFEHGTTVLYQAKSPYDTFGKADGELQKLAEIKLKLFNHRKTRIAPHRDEKTLASWNGLMITGLCWASKALAKHGDKVLAEKALSAAEQAFEFVLKKMARPGDRLYSVYKDGKARLNAYLDDYAFLSMAALDLARTLPSEEKAQQYTAQAQQWLAVLEKHFADAANGGFFFTSDDHEALIERPRTLFDQAIPSGTAVAIECQLALSEAIKDPALFAKADIQLYRLFQLVVEAPFGMGELSCAALMLNCGPASVSGAQGEQWCTHPHFFRAPLAADAKHPAGVLVCHKQACSMPLTPGPVLESQLREKLRFGEAL